MTEGDTNQIDFQWSLPALAPGTYRISLAVSDGDVEEFAVCDYIEDAVELRAGDGPGWSGGTVRGYFQLRCAAVTVHRN